MIGRVGRVAIWFLLVRSAIFLAFAVAGWFGGEVAMLVFLDLPTLGVYALLGAVGIPLDIQNHLDVVFHVIGSATWMAIGALIGSVVALSKRRQLRRRV